MRYMLGIDVGGTFTDFVAYDSETKAIDVWKHLSVPRDPVAGILAGLQQFAHPEAIRNARLGTTIATNAALERKGATVAYVTTKGFRDVIFIQRGNRQIALRHELGQTEAAGQATALFRGHGTDRQVRQRDHAT
jgi:N-methylhydantoinase A